MAYAFSTGARGAGPLDELPPEGNRRLWTWGTLIAVGGFLFGFDTGVISGALLYIKDDFDLNDFEQGSVVSVLLLGAMAGALGSGRLADRIGRRRTLMVEGVLFLIGTVVAVLAPGYWVLLLARIILGLAVGGASATVPVYLGEIAPASVRGRLLTLNQLLITVGILVSYLINLVLSSGGHWRAMIGAGAVPALVIVLACVARLIPESPQWLLANDQDDKARGIMAKLVGDQHADELLEKRRESLEEEEEGQSAGWRELLSASVRPALIVGLTLAAIQQFGGINTIIYYAPSIMQETGLTASNSIFYSVAIGIINLVMTIVALWLVGRLGRRPLLMISLGLMVVTLALLGLTFVAELSSTLSLVFMVLYIAAFAVGMGPLFWVMIGEIFPPHASAVGASAATAVNWSSNFVVSLVFLTVVNAIGQGQTFWIFGVICVLGVFFVAKYLPETKDREFPEIDKDIQARFGRSAQQPPA
ncbi:sugar porter family MFS transporter [Luteipulveratus sp. YIM 133132]|uniref:sugar porter family MFS transporter n=1 Tax=Luteipulveratus flavus TaxID=3031728 RepID=UPI0023B0A349|nr:sugar porter family MFS transporter [Luteipulveratus sp. YIM 133132]MDE9365071.1 sugar porter family MFS transporter [Luteipulveratus sp. YIM 133132]